MASNTRIELDLEGGVFVAEYDREDEDDLVGMIITEFGEDLGDNIESIIYLNKRQALLIASYLINFVGDR